VPDKGDDVGVLDGEIASPVLVGEVGTEERCEVRPELVEGSQPGRGTLTQAESAGAGRLEKAGAGGGSRRQAFLDEVDD
jgi:hypothetical protein